MPSLPILLVLTQVTLAWSFRSTVRTTRPQKSRLYNSLPRRTLLTTTAAAVLTGLVPPAQAELDYAKVQDLLGESSAPQTYAPVSSRPTYLEEPTAEFSENERKASEFKRKALQQRQEFQSMLNRMDTDPNDEAKLLKNLDDMRKFVNTNGGLPPGITKDELVKQIRRRKGRKPRYWPTEVEVAYQDLVAAILYKQSPNKDRDMDNPF